MSLPYISQHHTWYAWLWVVKIDSNNFFLWQSTPYLPPQRVFEKWGQARRLLHRKLFLPSQKCRPTHTSSVKKKNIFFTCLWRGHRKLFLLVHQSKSQIKLRICRNPIINLFPHSFPKSSCSGSCHTYAVGTTKLNDRLGTWGPLNLV